MLFPKLQAGDTAFQSRFDLNKKIAVRISFRDRVK